MSRHLALAVAIIACVFIVWRCCIYVPNVENFSDARAVMEEYVVYDHRETLYCGAKFDSDKRIIPPTGFMTLRYPARADRMEWEHAVPVENFGKNFRAWRDGHKYCEKDGEPFRGRKCARRVSRLFNRMEADMYNLFPAIGAVNAARRNYEYALLPGAEPAFGSCLARIGDRKFEPPERARGQIARAALYMDAQYPRFRLSRQKKKLFSVWNSMYPVDKWECTRTRRIERIQKNENLFVKEPCMAAGLW